jgi:magnesium transporter
MLRVAVAIAPEVRQLLEEDPAQLGELFEEIHEEDIADLIEQLGHDEGAKLLSAVPADLAARIFERLEQHRQESMVEAIGVENVASIVSEMSADDRTDLIEALPEAMGETLLEKIEEVDPTAAAEVEELAQWPEDSAGGLMTTDYVAVSPGSKVSEVIEKIRNEGTEAETVYYVYVVTRSNQLLGVASLRDILLATPDQLVEDIMTERVHAVSPTTDQEEVARTMAKYDFSALPVVGMGHRLLGVITVDDVIDVLTDEAREDVQRIGAIEPTEETYFRTNFWTFIKKRVVWLSVLFIGGFFTETALRRFDDVLGAVEALAFYVPLLISTGGNSGSQSASLMIRSLATGEVTLADWHRVLARELGQGVVMGLLLGGLGAVRAMISGEGPLFAITIFSAVLGIVIGGCVVGSMFPLLLRRLGLDPATSSTPFIATVVDVLGIVVYLTVARMVFFDVLPR